MEGRRRVLFFRLLTNKMAIRLKAIAATTATIIPPIAPPEIGEALSSELATLAVAVAAFVKAESAATVLSGVTVCELTT